MNHGPKKKLPVGIDGFEKIRKNDFYYVDKTMFIAELLQNWGEVNLFTRPRRFGKSLNMSMLKCFFEIGGDPTLFDGLKISREKELCEKYMGQFPVISVSLKSVEGRSFEMAGAAFRSVIGNEAMRFQFLQESERLSEAEKASYRRLIRVGTTSLSIFDMTDAVLMDSLQTLSQLLARHYGRKVILLIDEYDVPLDKAFHAGYYEEMVNLIRSMLGNALKSNENLFFAVLMGCLRISKESIFTGLNNLKTHTVTDSRYGGYFGFTETDVQEMLRFYGLSDHADAIREWYNGYCFGRTKVYCPWDVINYCKALREDPQTPPRDYWSNSSGNDLVKRLIYMANRTTKEEIERLINGESIVKPVRQDLTYKDIDSSIDNIWSVLFSAGYLTQRGNSYGDELELVIPNKEITKLFVRMAKEWFTETARADFSRIEKFCMAFPGGDADTICEMLGDYLWDSISVRDTAIRKSLKENFYHGMVLGLLRSRGDWIIRSNEELGEGYSDISICTPERTGIIVELKYQEDGNLEKGCAEAREQIETRKYAEGLKRQRVEKIIRYGIAFWEKECMVITA